MPRITRWIVGLAALAVLGVFVFPLWRVTLEAPQYPEGIGMLIHVNGVTGVKEHDLENINGLNHYIGMSRIEPDAIPELRYMPWIAAAIVLTGLLVAWRGSRALYIGWALTVLATLAAGVYDFWRWEYDYGHNLNPDAAIRIPGMAYQPPLFGSTQILNFVANSYPDTGGWMLIAAGVTIGLVLLYLLFGRRTPSPTGVPAARAMRVAATVAALAAAATSGCAKTGPRALVAGTDECAQCRMMITDARFGAEVVSTTGKVETFDAVECLTGYVAAAPAGSVQAVYVSDFEHPGTLIPADDAVYVVGATINSPMGRSLLALPKGTAPEKAIAKYGGTVSDWSSLLGKARTSASAAGTGAAHASADH